MFKGYRVNWAFYGWRVVAVAALGHYFAWAGSLLHTFSVMILPIAKETNWSRGEISVASSIASLTIMMCGPIFGYLVDRYGARLILTISTFLFGCVLCCFSLVTDDIRVFYGLFFLASLLGAGTIGPVYARLVFSWFDVNKGLAIGIVIGGAAAASAIDPPILNWIIGHYGWRHAYLILGLINLFVIFPLHFFYTRRSAQEMGFDRDGLAALPGAPSAQRESFDQEGLSFGAALRQPTFWALAFTFLLLAFGQGFVVHIVPVVVSLGFTSNIGVLVASTLGTSMLIARLVAGPLMDRIHVANLTFWMVAGSAVGIALLIFLGESLAAVLVGACLVGILWGAETDFMGVLVVTYFGRKASGRLHSLIFSFYVAGNAVGVTTVGFLYDATKSYSAALIIGFVACLVSLVLIRPLASRAVPKAVSAEAA